VPQRPQRPFVSASDSEGITTAVTTHSEFRLSRPFVPGLSREEVEAPRVSAPVEVTAPQPVVRSSFRRSKYFWTRKQLQLTKSHTSFHQSSHFLDPLPPVRSFAPDLEGALIEESSVAVEYPAAAPTTRPSTENGWLVEDWQQYDWHGAAIWERASNLKPPMTGRRRTGTCDSGARQKLSAAQALADALDQIVNE